MRILSGINPSSTKGLHLGNYVGMVKHAVKLQQEGECYIFVANLHSLNTIYNPKEVAENTTNVFIEYLAFGIDPDKSTFYVESDIPQIPYLQTILNNMVTVAELQRMHGYKDKLAKDVDSSTLNAGLFEYPVLMAADILLFDADIVPVGEDQTQHVEIACEIGRTFNNQYGMTFKIPKLSVHKDTSRVMGIDGQRKMSKSLGNDIPIFADEKLIHKQIMSITTDPARIRPTDPGDPNKNICFEYLRLIDFDNQQIIDLEARYRAGTVGDVEIKDLLYKEFMTYFNPFRQRKIALQQDLNKIANIRLLGSQKAQPIASRSLINIKKVCGI